MRKKLLSVLLALVVALSAALPAFAFDYPSGVTEETSARSAENLDVLVGELLPLLSEDDLAATVEKLIVSDDALSGIFTALYGKMDDYSSALKLLGIDVSPAALSAHLADFPDVSAAVGAVSAYSELDLSGVSWGVRTRGGFARAMSLMLAPFNDVLYMLLCSGRVNVSVVPIFGDDGYINGVVPMLNALGFFDAMSNDDFKADAAEWKGYMIENLVLMIFDLLDDVLASPVTELCSRLPNLAHFFKSGQFADAVDALLHPISLHIGDIITLVPATKLISILMFFTDTKKYTMDFTENMTTVLNDALESSDVELAEIDLDALRACGTERDGRIEANLGESFAEVMGWLLDTVKLNKDKLADVLKENDVDVSDYRSIIDSVLAKPTDGLLALIVRLMTAESGTENDHRWERPAFTPGSVDYGEDVSEEDMAKLADGIDETIEAFIVEGGEYKSLKEAVRNNIFTDAVVAKLCVSVYSLLGGEEIGGIVGKLGFDFSPDGVASTLGESRFAGARRTLRSAKSWDGVDESKLSFGVRKGSAKDFENALTAVLRPFAPLVRALLANRSLVLFDSLHIPGSNGYNSAVIPLLEALGCDRKKILTYEQYEKRCDGDGCLKWVIDPIVSLIDSAAKKPISKVIDILPNALLFIGDGSLMQCLINLLYPVTSLLEEVGTSLSDLGIDLDELRTTDLLSTISGAVPGLTDKVKLETPDLSKLKNLGTVETRKSRATFGGEFYDYPYEVADRAAVTVTVFRYVMRQLENEENADLIGGLMGGGDGGDSGDAGMFATYSASFGENFKGKTTDENLAFLYRLFFHERVTEETTAEPYVPHIIYEKQDRFEVDVTALVTAVFILLLFGTLALVNRRRIAYTLSTAYRRGKEKKAKDREGRE